MIGVEIIGLSDCLKGFENYKKESDRAIKYAVSDTANAIVKDAKNRLNANLKHEVKPRQRNSRLINSIMRKQGYEKDQFEAIVGTNVSYAPYVEFGTGDFVFKEFPFDEQAKEIASYYKGQKKVTGMRGVSFLNYAAVKNSKKFIEALTKRLNAIKR